MVPFWILGVGIWGSACVSGSEKVQDSVSETLVDEDSGGLEQDTASSEEDSGTVEEMDTAETEVDSPVNLLNNESFEEGEDGWNIWGGAARVAEEAQDGSWALKATEGNGAEQRVEGLEPNTIYRLSGWAKTEENAITIGVKDYGGEEQRVSFLSSEYTEQSLTFRTGFGSTSAIIYAYKHTGSDVAYADNLSLVYDSESPYVPVWSDEFDGDGAIDTSKWDFEEGFVRNQELQWYQSENAFQEDGYLVIEGREEQRPNPNYEPGSTSWKTSRETIEYTSSSLRTRGLFSWQYGRLVVRAKVTNHTGTWPAIWTLGIDCQWPSNGEVDVMENYGGDILANFAWGTNQDWSPNWDSSRLSVESLDPDWSNRFHIWELEWDADRMVIYLDGNELNSVSLSTTINGSSACAGQNPFQQPHYLLLNLALGGAGGSVDSLSFPTRYLVDYVRIYQEEEN